MTDIVIVPGELLTLGQSIEIIEMGAQGPAGAGGGGGLTTVYEFSYGDAQPVLIKALAAGKAVLAAALHVEIAFNGTGAQLSVGTLSAPNDLVAASQNNPAEVATYSMWPGKSYGVATDVYLFITPGGGASAGKAQVSLTVEP